MMHKRVLRKPDGRLLYLYSRSPIDPGIEAPSPSPEKVAAQGAHLRWHPLRGEWVAYASHRQNRTYLPPKDFNPLAPTTDATHPTELPGGDYDIAVFENMFPTLSLEAAAPPKIPGVLTRAALGACEVVVFAQDPGATLATLPTEHVALLLEVWGERYRALAEHREIQYIMPFENRGVEVGVTLHHPHGQIYAYSEIPPIPARTLEAEQHYFQKHGRGLVADLVSREAEAGLRSIYAGPTAVAFVPAFARYPYEVWMAPRRQVPSLAHLSKDERLDLARAMRTVLLKYDGLWSRPFPYLMVVHQAPTDGKAHPETHLRFEFYPPYRSESRLKFLAGTELGAGLYANDCLPEEKARELQAVEVCLD